MTNRSYVLTTSDQLAIPGNSQQKQTLLTLRLSQCIKSLFAVSALLIVVGCSTSPLPALPQHCIGGDCNWVYDGDMAKTSETVKKAHGAGTMKWPDGRRYTGTWILGKMDGKGAFTWPDGRSYKGQMQQNFMQGSGVLTWADGKSYTGAFAYNEMVLPGTFTLANGATQEVLEERPTPNSNTVVTWPSGDADPIKISAFLKKKTKRFESWELVETQGRDQRRMTIKITPKGFRVVGDITRDYTPDAAHNAERRGVFVRSSKDGSLFGRVLSAETLDDIRFVADLTNKKYYQGTKEYKQELTGTVSNIATYTRGVWANTYTLNGKLVGRYRRAASAPTSIVTTKGLPPKELVGQVESATALAIADILHVTENVPLD